VNDEHGSLLSGVGLGVGFGVGLGVGFGVGNGVGDGVGGTGVGFGVVVGDNVVIVVAGIGAHLLASLQSHGEAHP